MQNAPIIDFFGSALGYVNLPSYPDLDVDREAERIATKIDELSLLSPLSY